jgi:hypothetical protein
MMIRTSKERGMNVIGTILMLVTFFLVIGFGIGALATMNLNLSGRSVNAVKANQLAEAVVSEVMHYAQVEAEKYNHSISLNQLSAPSLYLDTRYDGFRNVFEPPPAYLGGDCSADVHFTSKGNGDAYYSTDNINFEDPVKGARGIVPPFTIDLIINVSIGNFTKHYQVFITRRWDYVLYCQDAPVHLLSCYDFTKNPPEFTKGTEINGTVFSRFRADPAKTYNQRVFLGEVPEHIPPLPYSGQKIYVNNIIPGEKIPASFFVGGEMLQQGINEATVPPTITYGSIGILERNSINGVSAFGFPGPSGMSPIYIYNNNSPCARKSVYGSVVTSPIDILKPIDDGLVSCKPLNETTSDSIHLIARDYYGIFRFDKGCSGTATVMYDKDGNAIADPQNAAQVQLLGRLRSDYEAKKVDYAASVRKVLWIEKSITTMGNLSGGQYEWGVDSRFVIKTQGGEYCPLVDMYKMVSVGDWTDTTTTNADGSYSLTSGFAEMIVEDTIKEPDNKIVFNNAMIVGRKNIELTHSSFSGDNSMLQVDGNVALCAGKISAGKKVGTVIFCNNLRCASSGTFRGVIFAKNSVKIGNPYDGAAPDMKGCIVVGGADPDNDPVITSVDYGGFVSHGFTLTYDPEYLQILNRFGKFRMVTWKEID